MRMAKPPTKKLRVPPFHWDEVKEEYVYDDLHEELGEVDDTTIE
jgi:hypothetical protein